MSNFELYQSLFLDSFFAGLFFTLDYEYIIWVIHLFGSLNKGLVISIPSSGYMLSIIFNYFFGILFYKISSLYIKGPFHLRYKKIKTQVNSVWWIILFTTLILGFGKFVFLFLGFLNIKPAATLIFGLLLKIIYYTYYIYNF
jgi:membrane protein YqaA with SNARE-associated domain